MPQCSMKPISDSNIQTYTLDACEFTSDMDENLVYIDSVSTKKNVVYIKPFNSGNLEGVNRAREIAKKGKLATISKISSGLILGVHKSQTPSLPKPNYTIVVKYRDESVDLGQVSGFFDFGDVRYGAYMKVHSSFVRQVFEQAKQEKVGV